ncbi:MAG TPA: hypothetical protein PK668_04985 [Myxococcota bacterium]|nr:hypothetical protein [Myxococcota bacterium]
MFFIDELDRFLAEFGLEQSDRCETPPNPVDRPEEKRPMPQPSARSEVSVESSPSPQSPLGRPGHDERCLDPEEETRERRAEEESDAWVDLAGDDVEDVQDLLDE